jgi:hypothetical protein
MIAQLSTLKRSLQMVGTQRGDGAVSLGAALKYEAFELAASGR